MTENDLQNKAEGLANRPYALFVFLDETTDGDTIYVATNPGLSGCVAQGDTAEEAESILAEVRADYFAHRLAHNLSIPEPGLDWKSVNWLPGQPVTYRIIEPDGDDALELNTQIAVFA